MRHADLLPGRIGDPLQSLPSSYLRRANARLALTLIILYLASVPTWGTIKLPGAESDYSGRGCAGPAAKPGGRAMTARRLCHGLGAAVTVLCAFAAVFGIGLSTAGAAPYAHKSSSLSVLDPGPCAGTAATQAYGTGFTPGEQITIDRDGAPIGAATADHSGGFTFLVMLSDVKNGGHVVSAAGQHSGRSASSGFQIRTTGCVINAANVHKPAAAAHQGRTLAYTGAPIVTLEIIAALLLIAGTTATVLGWSGWKPSTGRTT